MVKPDKIVISEKLLLTIYNDWHNSVTEWSRVQITGQLGMCTLNAIVLPYSDQSISQNPPLWHFINLLVYVCRGQEFILCDFFNFYAFVIYVQPVS